MARYTFEQVLGVLMEFRGASCEDRGGLIGDCARFDEVRGVQYEIVRDLGRFAEDFCDLPGFRGVIHGDLRNFDGFCADCPGNVRKFARKRPCGARGGVLRAGCVGQGGLDPHGLVGLPSRACGGGRIALGSWRIVRECLVFGDDARFVVICVETTKAPELRTEFEGLVNRGDLGTAARR